MSPLPPLLAPPSPTQEPLPPALEILVLNSLSSPHSRRAYAHALTRFFHWCRTHQVHQLSKAAVQTYRAELERQNLAPASLNLHLAAIRKLAAEAADNGLLDPASAAAIAKLRGARRLGVRAGNWLTPQQAAALLDAPPASGLAGLRDRALLALLLACGLRRTELASLDVASLQLREGRWVIPDLEGKGRRRRTVPVPGWVYQRIADWRQAAHIDAGPLFRPLDKAGRLLTRCLTPDAIWRIVRRWGAAIGQPQLTPHDLRRTCAHLCRRSGGQLEQIQLLLGHASIQTTERYLGSRQQLCPAVNDNLGLAPQPMPSTLHPRYPQPPAK
jgi:integrase